MPLGRMRVFKMSGEKPPLKVHYSQDKTQEQFRRQSSLITQAQFLFLIQIQVSIHGGKHPLYRKE